MVVPWLMKRIGQCKFMLIFSWIVVGIPIVFLLIVLINTIIDAIKGDEIARLMIGGVCLAIIMIMFAVSLTYLIAYYAGPRLP